ASGVQPFQTSCDRTMVACDSNEPSIVAEPSQSPKCTKGRDISQLGLRLTSMRCRRFPAPRATMIIDCPGHYTTAPKDLEAYRQRQISALKDSAPFSFETLKITD